MSIENTLALCTYLSEREGERGRGRGEGRGAWIHLPTHVFQRNTYVKWTFHNSEILCRFLQNPGIDCLVSLTTLPPITLPRHARTRTHTHTHTHTHAHTYTHTHTHTHTCHRKANSNCFEATTTLSIHCFAKVIVKSCHVTAASFLHLHLLLSDLPKVWCATADREWRTEWWLDRRCFLWGWVLGYNCISERRGKGNT